MTAVLSSAAPTGPAPGGARLLAGLDPRGQGVAGQGHGFEAHLERWGPLPPSSPRRLLDLVEAVGVRGHGGAWFLAGAKWRSVAAARGTAVVVANGAEGEPLSHKDAVLLTRAPHLVLDGAALAAAAVGAGRVVVYAPQRLADVVEEAVAERRWRRVDRVPVEVVAAPDRLVAGEESAVVRALDGGSARPAFTTLRPVRLRGVGGRPTLVQNVETLAHVALAARFGAAWFRQVGTPDEPGTALLSVTGRGASPVVVEAAFGTTMPEVLDIPAGDGTGASRGALLGGTSGGWVSMSTLAAMTLSEAEARRAGASLGAGVVALLPAGCCPVAETARVVRYLDREKAGQCGPCVHGLADLAASLHAVAFLPPANRGRVGELADLWRLCDLIDGRGACRHPDGTARLVRSAISVFGDEFAHHLRAGPCPDAIAQPAFLLPGSP